MVWEVNLEVWEGLGGPPGGPGGQHKKAGGPPGGGLERPTQRSGMHTWTSGWGRHAHPEV